MHPTYYTVTKGRQRFWWTLRVRFEYAVAQEPLSAQYFTHTSRNIDACDLQSLRDDKI